MKKYRLLLLLPMIAVSELVYGQQDSSSVEQQDSTAQEEAPSKTFVQGTFRNTQLINVQTPEKLDGLEFKIQHRFGINDSDAVYNWFGIQLPANIRLALSYPIAKRLDIGIGITKFNRVLDGEAKFILLRQTEGQGMPISAAIFANVGLSMEHFSKVPKNAFLTDSVTPFENKYTHRLDYRYELPIARKFSERFSLQLTPILVYQNIVAIDKDNYTAALNLAGRIKFGANRAVLFEYGYLFNNRDSTTIDPLSIAVEFGTAGHVFQIVAASSNELRGQKSYTHKNADYTKPNFYLGFNIKRIWWF